MPKKSLFIHWLAFESNLLYPAVKFATLEERKEEEKREKKIYTESNQKFNDKNEKREDKNVIFINKKNSWPKINQKKSKNNGNVKKSSEFFYFLIKTNPKF